MIVMPSPSDVWTEFRLNLSAGEIRIETLYVSVAVALIHCQEISSGSK